jgi:hypothetical protein
VSATSDTFRFVLLLYSAACVYVFRLARAAMVRVGIAAATAGLIANAWSMIRGSVRPVLAIPVLILACIAAAQAFKIAEGLPRDTDEERRASQAGMALAGLSVAEGLIILVGGFLWATS